jgi:hypothetical protein
MGVVHSNSGWCHRPTPAPVAHIMTLMGTSCRSQTKVWAVTASVDEISSRWVPLSSSLPPGYLLAAHLSPCHTDPISPCRWQALGGSTLVEFLDAITTPLLRPLVAHDASNPTNGSSSSVTQKIKYIKYKQLYEHDICCNTKCGEITYCSMDELKCDILSNIIYYVTIRVNIYNSKMMSFNIRFLFYGEHHTYLLNSYFSIYTFPLCRFDGVDVIYSGL